MRADASALRRHGDGRRLATLLATVRFLEGTHENIRSLAIYTNVTPDAVAAALAEHDPGRRHR